MRFVVAGVVGLLLGVSLYQVSHNSWTVVVGNVRDHSGQTRFDVQFPDRSSVLRCGVLRVDGDTKANCWWMTVQEWVQDARSERLSTELVK